MGRAGLVVPVLLSCLLHLLSITALYRANKSGRRWTHRRRRLATMAAVEVSLQVVNSIMFLVPNR